MKTEVTYLGHIISKNGVKPDPRKLEAVKLFPRPKTPKNIKQFLGLAGYYRRFIPNFSKLAKPLTNLLKNDTRFEWTSAQEESFEILKQLLCKEPVLQYSDFSRPFILTTDASGIAVGGILSQGEINKDRPIAYASRTLTDNELKYDTYEKEALAIVYCVKHFRSYLYGRKFTLVTNHKPLMWFKNAQDANMRILRWRLKLAQYDYEVVYKAGKTNVNADALSRNPIDFEEVDCKPIRKGRRKRRNSKVKKKAQEKINEKEEDHDYEFHLSDSSEEEEEDNYELRLSDVEESNNAIQNNSLKNDLLTHTLEEEDDYDLHLSDIEEDDEYESLLTEYEEDDNYKLYLSDDEKNETGNNTDSIPFTQEELNEPSSQIIERALIHDPPKRDKILTRNRTMPRKTYDQKKELKESIDDEIISLDDKDNPPDNNDSDNEDEEEGKRRNFNEENKSEKHKPTIITSQTIKNNIIESRELLFLRKDNLVYFVDTHGKPLDSGSQKLFERNELPNLGDLTLGQAKAIKPKNYYHIALTISEGQLEGPTLTLNYYSSFKRFKKDIRKLKY